MAMPEAPRRLRALQRHLSGRGGALAAPVPAAAPAAAAVPGALSAEQIEQYVDEGYVVVGGLIPEPILAAARDSIWAQMAGPPKLPEEDAWAPGGEKKRERPSPQRADRSTWPAGDWTGMVDGDAIAALFTPAWHRAAQSLATASAEVRLAQRVLQLLIAALSLDWTLT
jgi:hypothetical protein